MRIIYLIYLSFCLISCGLRSKTINRLGCDAEESIWEINYQPSIKQGYRFVRYKEKNIDELLIIINGEECTSTFRRNGTTIPISTEKNRHLLKKIGCTREGDFMQVCSNVHYDFPIDSLCFIDSGKVKFQYVCFSNTPLQLSENAIEKIGSLNIEIMKNIYSIYYEVK